MLFFIFLSLLQEANEDVLVDVVLTGEIPTLLHHGNGAQSSMKQQLHWGSLQLLKDLRLACSHRQHPWDCLHLTELHRRMLNLSPVGRINSPLDLKQGTRGEEVKRQEKFCLSIVCGLGKNSLQNVAYPKQKKRLASVSGSCLTLREDVLYSQSKVQSFPLRNKK